MLTYTITPGEHGNVVLTHGKTVVARKPKAAVLAQDNTTVQHIASLTGHDLWMHLGILNPELPADVTLEDVAFAFLIARDELIDHWAFGYGYGYE